MVGDVVSQEDYFCWSLSQLSREFGIARETVTRRLNDAGVISSGNRRGHPVYRVGRAAEAIIAPKTAGGIVINDPEKMTPKEQRDWYAAQLDRKKLAAVEGETVSTNESREQMAIIAKTGLQVLETLPDILERDFNLDAEIIVGVEERIDAIREQWATLLEGEE